jgi:tRNA(Ile)-lysidine synthase
VTRPEDAVSVVESDAAFARLKAYHHVILAVSGGPDSMALLALAAEWHGRAESPVPTMSVATVDHRLRAESADEAATVARISVSLGLEHATLTWEGRKPSTGLPNAAREARYALLSRHAARFVRGDHSRIAIVTAHTEDDQAETVFMRAARGGGVRALAAMAPVRRLAQSASEFDIDIVRPMLALAKRRLIATLVARGIPYFEDATNVDSTYERPRVRQAIAASTLDPAALAETARRMREALSAIDYAKRMLAAAAHASFHGGIYFSCDRTAVAEAPSLVRAELLRDVIGALGGETPAPEAAEIERLSHRLHQQGTFRATLGGAVVSSGQRHIRVWREPGRLHQQPVPLMPGKKIVWDARFLILSSVETGVPLVVRPLGAEAWGEIVRAVPGSQRPPAAAAHGLPAIYRGSKLLAVHPIGFYMPPDRDAGAQGVICKLASAVIERGY